MFNPHASLCFILFYFFFLFSLFFAPSPDYLNGWNGLFGYDGVDISYIAKKRLDKYPLTRVLYV